MLLPISHVIRRYILLYQKHLSDNFDEMCYITSVWHWSFSFGFLNSSMKYRKSLHTMLTVHSVILWKLGPLINLSICNERYDWSCIETQNATEQNITQTVFPFTICTTLLTQQITICHTSTNPFIVQHSSFE